MELGHAHLPGPAVRRLPPRPSRRPPPRPAPTSAGGRRPGGPGRGRPPRLACGRDGSRPPAPPVLWTLFAVAIAVGAPFLALASVSPTLQRWYASAAPGVDPYVLYAAGNAELHRPPRLSAGGRPHPGLGDQRGWWTVGYLAFAVLFLVCAGIARRAVPVPPSSPVPTGVLTPAGRRMLVRWAGMAAGPSLLLLGTTRHLSTDVAAIPLLWLVPLSVYLLTFIVAFSGRGGCRPRSPPAWHRCSGRSRSSAWPPACPWAPAWPCTSAASRPWPWPSTAGWPPNARRRRI